MNVTEWIGKGLRLVYTFGKWALGVIVIGVVGALVLSIFHQSQVENSIENGMTRASGQGAG